MPATAELIRQLSRTQIYQDYVEAFGGVTKLPLVLRPVEPAGPVHRGRKYESVFCAMMAESSRACAACIEVQRKIAVPQGEGACSAVCHAGLSDTAVPVRVGARLIGFLQTGQVALTSPSTERFEHLCSQLRAWGVKIDLVKLENAYFHSRVLSPQKYHASVRLLEIFAKHLALVANQLAIQQSLSEPLLIGRARAYIDRHQADALSLDQVVKALHVSTSYFCKLFKKSTGLTFTNYLGHVRVESAKTLLLNPNKRVSEIAYETGFQSLTHFNRTFRQLVGQSPTDYRVNLAAGTRQQI